MEETTTIDDLVGEILKSFILTLITDISIEEYRIVSLKRIKTVGSSNSFLATPKILVNVASSGNTSRASSPGGGGKKDTSALYDCLNCGRSIAFSRYASHLSGCMDLKNGSRTRRAPGGFSAANGLKKRTMNGSVSPYPSDDDGGNGKNIVKLSTGRRAASPGIGAAAAIASLKFKKVKSLAGSGSTLNSSSTSPLLTSHPLSKSLSLPALGLPPSLSVPIPSKLNPASSPTSIQMSTRISLPHSLPLKPPPPLSVFNNKSSSSSSIATNSSRPQSLPPSVVVPLKSSLPVPLPVKNGGTNGSNPNHNLNSDRPDSDSSDEDDPQEEARSRAASTAAAAARLRSNGTTGVTALGKRGAHPLRKDRGSDSEASSDSESD